MTIMVAVLVAACGSSNSGSSNAAPAQNNATATSAKAPDTSAIKGKKVLVAYFSVSGNTKAIAEEIHKKTGGDLIEIKPAVPYSQSYNEARTRAHKERDEKARPELTTKIPNMKDYDLVLLGYPIWSNDMPMAVYTFVESYDWNGKTIVPFATSIESDIIPSVANLKKTVQGANVLDGLIIRSDGERRHIDEWLKKSGF